MRNSEVEEQPRYFCYLFRYLFRYLSRYCNLGRYLYE